MIYISPQQRIGDRLAEYQAAFDILGRIAVLQHAQPRVKTRLSLARTSRMQFDDSDDVVTDGNVGSDVLLSVDFKLPSLGAINYIRNLTPVTKSLFDGLTDKYKVDAITIAGVTDQRLIAKVQNLLRQNAESGDTLQDFKRQIASDDELRSLTAFDIETAYQTTMQKAYSRGRYEQMADEEVQHELPFWQYWTVGDDSVRPEHRVLDQFVARAVDPVWRKIYPPCGYGCRCSAVSLTEEEALKADSLASEGGWERLPLLAKEKVPAKGFTPILAAFA